MEMLKIGRNPMSVISQPVDFTNLHENKQNATMSVSCCSTAGHSHTKYGASYRTGKILGNLLDNQSEITETNEHQTTASMYIWSELVEQVELWSCLSIMVETNEHQTTASRFSKAHIKQLKQQPASRAGIASSCYWLFKQNPRIVVSPHSNFQTTLEKPTSIKRYPDTFQRVV